MVRELGVTSGDMKAVVQGFQSSRTDWVIGIPPRNGRAGPS
jgi:predicted methyltransferase